MSAPTSVDWRYPRFVALLTVGLLSAILAVNWVVDPFRFYHAAFFPIPFPKNQRFINPGIARTCRYDSVIVGTSVTEHLRPSRMRDALGWNALKLSMCGSTAREQHAILNHALGTGQVRRVLWGIDFFSFQGGPDRVPDPGAYLLLSDSPPALQYLLSSDTLLQTVRVACGIGVPTVEQLGTWDDRRKFGIDHVFAHWRQRRAGTLDPGFGDAAPVDMAAVETSVRRHLVEVIAAHPEIEFHVFFPPYSVVWYLHELITSPAAFQQRLEFKADVCSALSRLPNCRLYDFEPVSEITHDLDQYEDMVHYGPAIDDFIVHAVARGEHRMNDRNRGERLRQFEDSVCLFAERAAAADYSEAARLPISQEMLRQVARAHRQSEPPPRIADEGGSQRRF